MKKWRVTGVDPSFELDIERVIGLFFPKAKVNPAGEEETDGFLDFVVREEGGQIIVSVTLNVLGRKDQTWVATDQKETIMSGTPKEIQRRVKHVIKHALLQVLEKATGTRQPWGILTGVRPTKLYHGMMFDQVPVEEAKRVLKQDYALLPDKVDLLDEIVQRQTTVLPDLYQLDQEVSLYIGIPFCPTKCAYCTFPAYAIQGRNGSVEEFLKGLHEEITAVGEWLHRHDRRVTTIYFGGGTPTSITADQLEALFLEIKQSIPNYDLVRELTVEAGRPDTLDVEKLALLKRWKVDRISINPQSFEESTLKLIGRHHTVRETLDKFYLAREMGLHNINMDLIIGLPNEGLDRFRQSLRVMEELRPESLTVHTLSFKRGSHMTRNPDKYRVAEGEEIAQMVQEARAWTRNQGYVPYYLYRQKNILGNQENVGYAFPGEESLYNISIMEERQTIIGLGCGAVSKIIPPGGGRLNRWPNPKEPQAYIDTVQEQTIKKLKALDQAYGTIHS
ncbi:coproporphyrinogen III oxidase [Marininema halotolerans]|uniref:Oxygen-independent coproporphyrinogen-3 oxidase n=1 Tax=Marininema halotolerans TaxID=1155944 RepID=A0A1I6U6J1_9BACL|nr:coproporphyrinogen III oxidase [Marininema halotolerans]SFS97035.1 oxygen-independent coproporphyrinogen-3 oxidase [Marininema halotolerans]